ncbi:MAG: hypothetical protein JKY52_18775 [Flavobacteriales bacterium]|nr:hypothetical protein [Flavobacteriales bacterium]
MTLHRNFIVDETGNKVAVMVDIKDYKKMVEAVEELEDIKAYDKSKRGKQKPIPAKDAFKEIETSRKKK